MLFSSIASGEQIPQQSAAGSYGTQAQPAESATGPVIQGLEGLRGFGAGHSQLSLAVIPLSQQGNLQGTGQGTLMTFQVNGFAVSIPETGEAVVYSLETPLAGVIDPSQNTLQIDISGVASAIDTAGYIDSSEVYDIIRSDPKVMVIDVDLRYAGKQGSQTIFDVDSVDIIFPDGRMQTYSLQQPTHLVIDTQNDIVAMVAFPEMVDTYGSYYGTAYDTVAPVVYTQPVPIVAPVVTPYLYPMPFYTTGFVWYNRFFFGNDFRPFWNRDRIDNLDRFSNADRFPVRQTRNDFADRSRNTLQTAQRRGDFTQSRQLGANVNGGIGGFRGGVKKSASVGGKAGGRAGGVRAGGGGGRRR